MRYGLLSDIHGNLFALRAAIDRLTRAGVDEWLCAGDVIGYGPHPNECVQAVAELGARCVVGNHELMLLGEISERRCGPAGRRAMSWTRSVLTDDCHSYLAQLPRVVTAPGLVMTHGALGDPERYIRKEPQAAEQLGRLEAEHPDARLLLLGHTHRPWVFGQLSGTVTPAADGTAALPAPQRFLINPGSIGQSRHAEPEPLARFMLLDTERGQVRSFTSSFDVPAARTALRRAGLPEECIHQRRGVVPTTRRRARGVLRKLADAAASSAGTGRDG